MKRWALDKVARAMFPETLGGWVKHAEVQPALLAMLRLRENAALWAALPPDVRQAFEQALSGPAVTRRSS